MHTTSPESALRQARWHLLEHGECPVDGVDERVARSWRRSLAAGLLPAGRALETEHADAGEVRDVRAFNHDLLAHSQPVMEYLFEQVRHSQGMVILADPRGTLMHTLGHADFLSKAERVALSCGASWNEQHRGTNAIGTALVEGGGIEIHGAEHFFDRNDFLTCTAVPIHSGRGEVMGILDISGDQRSGHPHTLGLVGMAARMIENRLLTASRRHPVRLHLHPRAEGIGTVAEGILALSNDGWIVGANRSALAMLGLGVADLGALPLQRRLDVRLEELLSRHRFRPGQPVPIHLHDGTPLFAAVHAEPPALGTNPEAMASLRWLLTMASTASSCLGCLRRAAVATSWAESNGPLPSMPTSSSRSTIAMAREPMNPWSARSAPACSSALLAGATALFFSRPNTSDFLSPDLSSGRMRPSCQSAKRG